MSRKNNVNPDYYKTAGRDRPNEVVRPPLVRGGARRRSPRAERHPRRPPSASVPTPSGRARLSRATEYNGRSREDALRTIDHDPRGRIVVLDSITRCDGNAGTRDVVVVGSFAGALSLASRWRSASAA